MMFLWIFTYSLTLLLFSSLFGCTSSLVKSPDSLDIKLPEELYFTSIQQLTHGGINTKAHWSEDLQLLSFQHRELGIGSTPPLCNQIYTLKKDGSEMRKISTDPGNERDPFFLPKNKKQHQRIGFTSSAPSSIYCPPSHELGNHLNWVNLALATYPSYLFGVHSDGTDRLPLEPGAPKAYNSEAATCQDGSIVFTSNRNGDLHLYRAQLDSLGTFTEAQQVTQDFGYHGNPSFSFDCKQLVWTAYQPRKGRETVQYHKGLLQNLIHPLTLEIWIEETRGTPAYPVTHLGALSLSPTFTPDGKKILFASNLRNPKKLDFDLYLVNRNGTGLKQITHSHTSDNFPQFSPDGKFLVFSSRRNAKLPNEMNLFIAKWEDPTHSDQK